MLSVAAAAWDEDAPKEATALSAAAYMCCSVKPLLQDQEHRIELAVQQQQCQLVIYSSLIYSSSQQWFGTRISSRSYRLLRSISAPKCAQTLSINERSCCCVLSPAGMLRLRSSTTACCATRT
jgi:hypothetical protein